MIMEPSEILAIVEQYKTHGWKLRRALLSAESAKTFAARLTAVMPEVTIVSPPAEALWFSRRSLPDREAWELRRLSGSPFALVALLEDSMDDDEKEEILKATELRMVDGSHPEPTSH